jgi:microcystin-dependent protein
MADHFLGQISITSLPFAPKNWAFCDGQLLPISTNQALFSLLGTTYGGNGVTTFALPDLRGRRPVSMGTGYVNGQSGGSETQSLSVNELPGHAHSVMAQSAVGTQDSPAAGFLSASGVDLPFAPALPVVGQRPLLNPAGNSQPHENRPPYLVLNFIIALTGIFPSRD